DQNRNSGGGAAPNRYGSSVSNNDSMRWSSTSLCSSTASIAGTRPRTTNIRPPGRSQPLKRDGMASTAPVTQIASKLRPGSQANTSPTTTSTVARPCACRRPCAASARSAWRSMLTTSRASPPRHAHRPPRAGSVHRLEHRLAVAQRLFQVSVGERALAVGDEGLARHAAEHLDHPRVEDLPGADLLLDHQLASLGEIERHRAVR